MRRIKWKGTWFLLYVIYWVTHTLHGLYSYDPIPGIEIEVFGQLSGLQVLRLSVNFQGSTLISSLILNVVYFQKNIPTSWPPANVLYKYTTFSHLGLTRGDTTSLRLTKGSKFCYASDFNVLLSICKTSLLFGIIVVSPFSLYQGEKNISFVQRNNTAKCVWLLDKCAWSMSDRFSHFDKRSQMLHTA